LGTAGAAEYAYDQADSAADNPHRGSPPQDIPKPVRHWKSSPVLPIGALMVFSRATAKQTTISQPRVNVIHTEAPQAAALRRNQGL
jgi:hypothetical protein